MLTVELLPAGQGDAILVEWGPEKDTQRLLVDAGPRPHWKNIRPRLLAGPAKRFALWVVTHVDEDHIGGAIQLLNDPLAKVRVKNVWFNGYVQCAGGGNVLGPVHGERFTQLLASGGYSWNFHFQAKPPPAKPANPGVAAAQGDGAELRRIALPGGASVVLLAPNGPKLTKLADEWKCVVTKAGIVAGKGTEKSVGAVKPGPKEVDPLPARLDTAALQKLAMRSKSDGSAANGSSIAFVFEYEGKRVLLTGDAHPQPLTRNLARYGQLVGEERPHLDLVTLPHHGSGANVTTAFAAAIDADRYLISSDGMGYAHPHDSAIARLILGSPRPVTFFCNYDSYRVRPWADRADEVPATFVLPNRGQTGMKVSA